MNDMIRMGEKRIRTELGNLMKQLGYFKIRKQMIKSQRKGKKIRRRLFIEMKKIM